MDDLGRRDGQTDSQAWASGTGSAIAGLSGQSSGTRDNMTNNTATSERDKRIDAILASGARWDEAMGQWMAIRDSQTISDQCQHLPSQIAHNPDGAILVLKGLIHQARLSKAWSARLDEIMAEGRARIEASQVPKGGQ